MSNLQGQKGELHFTIEIKRKATGKIEKYDLIGHVLNEETKKENENGSNS